jgi:hypothetical protein
VTDGAVATSLTSDAERERGTRVPVIRRFLCIFRRRNLVIAAPRRRYAGDTPRRTPFHIGGHNIVIGMSDGLTVPFALAAGLPAPLSPRRLQTALVGGLAASAAFGVARAIS